MVRGEARRWNLSKSKLNSVNLRTTRNRVTSEGTGACSSPLYSTLPRPTPSSDNLPPSPPPPPRRLHRSCIMSLPTSSLPPLPGPSPLKQLNASGQPRPISKLEASWQQLASNPHLFDSDSPSTSPSPPRYFADFFCLKPQLAVQRAALDNLSVDDLLGPYKVRPVSSRLFCCPRSIAYPLPAEQLLQLLHQRRRRAEELRPKRRQPDKRD